MPKTLTNAHQSDVDSGSVVNEVRLTYNEFGQLVQDFQAHGGAVVTGTTPKTQYLYANGSANTVRRTHQFYPDGRVTTYDYGSADGMNDVLSRVAALRQGTNSLAAYTYLGLGEFVREKYD